MSEPHTQPALHADSLVYNVYLATLDEDRDSEGYAEVHNGLVAWQGGRIVYAGPEDSAPAFESATRIDGQGGWLTPGLVDCHTHLVYAGSRADEFEALRQGKTYAEIARTGGGIKRTVAATREASEEQLIEQAQQRLDQLLAEGVTTVEIKSGYGLSLDSELKMLRVIRELAKQNSVTVKATCLAAHAVPLEFTDNTEGYLDLVIEQILPAVKTDNLADTVDVFCESIAFNARQTTRLFQMATELGFKVKGHVEQLTQQNGTDVVCEFNGLSADHVEFTNAEQAKKMADKDVIAVILPGAFYYLSETQKPPVAAFRQANVNMAIATDQNPGSSPLCSLLTAANMACVLFSMTPAEAFAGITRNGAKALGQKTGQLREGFDADILLWQVEHPRQIIHELNRFKPARIWHQGKERTHD